MDTISFLKQTELFNSLDDRQLATVSQRTKLKAVAKKTPVIIVGEVSNSLYIIKSGGAKVVVNDDKGNEMILSSLRTGDVFGELSLLDEKPRSANVITTENSELLVLSKADFLELLRQNSELAMQIIKYLCQKIRFTNVMTQNLAMMDVYERFRSFLYTAVTTDSKGRLATPEPMSHNDIAAHIGCNRAMVSRIIRTLAKGGYISVEQKIIIINAALPKRW